MDDFSSGETTSSAVRRLGQSQCRQDIRRWLLFRPLALLTISDITFLAFKSISANESFIILSFVGLPFAEFRHHTKTSTANARLGSSVTPSPISA